jgi:uncharacterized protein (TIGR03905 family)
MPSDNTPKRFIFHTRGVCPPEIHFSLSAGILEHARFVGGGCPGNAHLVSRLISGSRIQDVMDKLKDIDCRNGTSCPGQLRQAIKAAVNGTLKPSEPCRIVHDPTDWHKIAFISGVHGDPDVLERLIDSIREEDAETIFCMGNLTGNSLDNSAVIRRIAKEKIMAIQGDLDLAYAQSREKGLPQMQAKDRDWLVRLPQLLTFQLADRKAMAFFGQFVQELPGFSDYDDFALEVNMVADLTDFMTDESVFPALEAMIPQFRADVIIFGQTDRAGHWRVGGKDFIGLAPAADDTGPAYTVISATDNGVAVETKSSAANDREFGRTMIKPNKKNI